MVFSVQFLISAFSLKCSTLFAVILIVSQIVLIYGCYTAKTLIIVEFKYYIAFFFFSILGFFVMLWFQHIFAQICFSVVTSGQLLKFLIHFALKSTCFPTTASMCHWCEL